MPRLDQMTMRELEEIGQRFYESKGLLAGEDPPDDEVDYPAEFIEDDDVYDDLRERYLDEQ